MRLFFLLSLCLLTGCASGGEPAPEILTEPPALTVRCADTSAEALRGAPAEEVSVENGTIVLWESGSVYEVVADWSSAEHWGGTAHYSFHAGPAA